MKKRKQELTRLQKAAPLFRYASIAVAAIGVFWLPWHVGSMAPALGESYSLGFDNHVGILALGLAIFLGAAASYFNPRRTGAYRWLRESPQLFPRWKEACAEYVVLIAMCALLSGVLLFWGAYLEDPAWCEARQFIYGIDLLALGQVPYRDFMFNYGPGTIYFPFWLSNLTGGGISFEQSYDIFLALFTVAGFIALFVFLRSVEIPNATRPWVLGLAAIVWTCISMGLHYTPIRFYIVPAAVIFLHAVASRQTGRDIKSLLWIAPAAGLATTACLIVSPEMGIAGAAAVCAYGLVLLLRKSILGASACWLGSAVMFVATLLIFPGYLDSVFSFESGGSNFPIYADLHNVCLVVTSLIVISPLIASAFAEPGEKRAPLALALAVGGGMLLPAAFGRCDPGHTIINGVIPSIMMFPAAAMAGKAAFRTWFAVYAILFVALSQFSYWNQYVPNYQYAIRMHKFYKDNPQLVATWRKQWDATRLASPYGKNLHWSKYLYYPEGLGTLTGRGRVLLTSGNEANLWLARFLLLQKDPPREYYEAYSQGASTPAQIARKVREDRAYDFLMMPQWVIQDIGQIDLSAYARQENAFMSKLFLFPINVEVKNPPYLPDSEFAKQILQYYKPVAEYNDKSYVILQKEDEIP